MQAMPFEIYTREHGLPIALAAIAMTVITIVSVRVYGKVGRKRLGIVLSFIPVVGVLYHIVNELLLGTWTAQEDLPLHLCRVVALTMPYVIWTERRQFFGVLYFFAVVGGSAALAFPDITSGIGSAEHAVYFAYHGVLVGLPWYCVVAIGWSVTWQHLRKAVLWINIYMIITLAVNILLGSNYFYTLDKPTGPTVLDHFGPWPIYLVVVEGLMVVLFVVALLPFIIKRKK